MTFDIVLCVRSRSEIPSLDSIRSVLLPPQNALKPDSEKVETFEHMNKATGVYFVWAYSRQEAGTEVHGAPHLFDSGLMVHVNFGRPSYFAHECFDTLQSIAKKLGLYLFYSQPLSPSEVPEPSTSQMLEQWSRINTDSVQRVRKDRGGRIRFIPKEKLDSVWSYNSHKHQLYKMMGERYFIPNTVFAVERTGSLDERCYTCCGWPDFRPEVFPQVEYVIVRRDDRSTAYGLVGLGDVQEVLRESYLEASEPIRHILLEHPSEVQIAEIRAKVALRDEEIKVV